MKKDYAPYDKLIPSVYYAELPIASQKSQEEMQVSIFSQTQKGSYPKFLKFLRKFNLNAGEKKLVVARYYEGKKWSQIMQELSYKNKWSVYKHHERILEKIKNKLLFLRQQKGE